MSRAFVKESDGDEPDDLPELPVSEHPNYVTARGLALLQARLDAANRQRTAIDPEADGGKLARAYLARDIRWLEARIGGALLQTAHNPERVAFGATVEAADANGNRLHYRIVGEDEADPEHGLVSWVSPLARALLGAHVGDTVCWRRPAGDLEIQVLTIGYEEPAEPG